MATTGWQAIGRIAKARRDRLGLNQNELALFGGPGVATVGKFERAAQSNFPLRTQHQIENALGWTRGTVEQVVKSIDDGELTEQDWEHDLIEEDVPDLGRPANGEEAQQPALEDIEAFVAMVLRLIPRYRRMDALRAGLVAIAPYLETGDSEEVERRLSGALGETAKGGDGDADRDTGGAAPTNGPLRAVAQGDEGDEALSEAADAQAAAAKAEQRREMRKMKKPRKGEE